MYTTTPKDAAPQDTATPAPAASDELTWADRVLSEIPPCPIPSAGTGAFAARALRMSKDKASPKEDDKAKAILTAMDFSAKFEDALSLVCALALADVCAGNTGARESWRRAMAARRLNDEACALLQGPMALPRPKVRR
ncbi:hypothetical protein [Gemmatimonas sp.]|uniref:hypothetical protein n=1 Tax=Gemmatimonas sp. TaxID=1962908 RepID=UPI00286AC442|nr:hypothetical protein [Gemmatimonas sp.]